MKDRRVKAVILFAVFFLAVLMPLPHHDCDGDHCAVCAAILAARYVLTGCVAVSAVVLMRVRSAGTVYERGVREDDTPVGLHVLILD